MVVIENITSGEPSTYTPRKAGLTRQGSLINPPRPSKKGRNDTAKRGGGRPSRMSNSNNNNPGGETPLTVSDVARMLPFNVNKPKTYEVSNVAKEFMKRSLVPKAGRELVNQTRPSSNKSKALTTVKKPSKTIVLPKEKRNVTRPTRINEPESQKMLGSASSENVPIIKTKVRKKREQKPRARRMRRPAKRESPKPKTPETPETETETKPRGPTTAVKPRSPTITKPLPTNGQSTASETKPKPNKVGPITAVKKRSPTIKKPLPPNGQPKTVITVNNNSVEKIISAIKNSKPKSKTPPSVNIKRFLEPFKQPISIQFAPTIQATGGSSKSNAMATQIQPDKSAKKKKPFKKFDVLADPASAYRKSVVASKRKEIMSKLRTPTVGQRKKHVIQLIDRVLRKMKAPKDTEKKLIKLYESLSEKQIKSLFGGRSPEFVKKTLKKQVEYLKKKR
jgi:hypothetical protein